MTTYCCWAGWAHAELAKMERAATSRNTKPHRESDILMFLLLNTDSMSHHSRRPGRVLAPSSISVKDIVRRGFSILPTGPSPQLERIETALIFDRRFGENRSPMVTALLHLHRLCRVLVDGRRQLALENVALRSNWLCPSGL